MQYEELINLLTDNQQALMKAIDKDLVYRTPMDYIIYDHFLAIWLTRQS
jgi:hypothetical protein